MIYAAIVGTGKMCIRDRIYLAAGTIRTCNYIMNSCYRAGGEAVFGTVLEIVCLFTISVPATWIAGMVLHLPFLAVFAFRCV